MTATGSVARKRVGKAPGGFPDPYILVHCVRDARGRSLDFQCGSLNPAAEALVGGWGPRLSGWTVLVGLPRHAALMKVVDGGPSLTFEVHTREAGAERWFQARAVKHADGLELWLSDFTQAHAERRALRDALARERLTREREAYLGLALDTARMVTWEWSEARGAFTLSPNAESFFGLPPDALGDHSLEVLLGRVQAEERAHIAEVFERMRYLPGPHSFLFQSEWPDGSLHVYEVVGRSFHEEGQPVRVLGVAMECTARERAQTALREAEERYRLAALATRDVLWEWCARDGGLLWGEASARVLGHRPEDMGGLDWWMAQVHPEDRERVEAGLLAMRDSSEEAWSAEYRFRHRDGSYVDVLDRGRAARDARGRLVRMIGSMMDITERKRALVRMQEEARFRERFIGILGHDLRSPLHAISLSARELRRRELPARLVPLAQRIESSAVRMGNMISDILDLTRARLAGGIPLHLSPTSLPRVCWQVVEELEVAWPQRLISVEAEGPCEGIWDWERLAQVVSNLVGNALTHAAPEDPIFVRCWQQAGRQVLEIANPGPPIPPDVLGTLFNPFGHGRSVRTGRGSGLGLGLFIVHEVVRAHGGEVSVRSEEGLGTCFRVTLPVEPGGAASAEAPAAG